MLFLWSKDPIHLEAPRTGPVFGWLATAILFWRCRRRLARAIFGPDSPAPLKVLKQKKRSGLLAAKVRHSNRLREKNQNQQLQLQQQEQLMTKHLEPRRKPCTVVSAPVICPVRKRKSRHRQQDTVSHFR